MRPPGGALLLALAFGAGLVTGLSRFPDPLSVLLATLAAWWLLPRPRHRAVTVLLLLGMIHGRTTARAAVEHCAHRLPHGEATLLLRTVEPGMDAGRVEVVAPSCDGVVSARWPEGVAIAAGREVAVTARWLPRPGLLGRPGGLLVVRTVVSVGGGSPGRVARIRSRVTESITRRFGARAPLVEALVTGRRGAIEPNLREAFVGAGLIHLLAISGFHVGLLGGWLLLLLRLGGAPRHGAELAAAGATMAYAAWLGWPAPATRAATLLVGVALARARQRHPRFDGLLGVSALVVLARMPWSVVDLGAWLSFAAVAGVGWALGWSDRAIGRATWQRAVAASIGATLVTAPIAALMLGRVATVGILLNVVAIPLVAAAMPAVLLAVLLDPVAPYLAGAFASAADVLLAALTRLALAGAGWPGASSVGAPGWGAAVPWLLALAAALWVTHGRTTRREAGRRAAWIAAVALWWPLATSLPALRPNIGDEGLALHLLGVGQGDAIALRTPGGHWVLVDAGPAGTTGDAGARVVGPYLARQGVRRIEVFVLSHAHRDHVGGGASLVGRFPVGLALDPGEAFAEAGYDAWLEALAARGSRWRVARAGDTWELDGVTFRVLHPPTTWSHRGHDLNEDSIVLEVGYGAFRALLTGDAGFPAESALAHAGGGPVALLKVGHHGSRGSTAAAFLAALAPQAAVISVGRNGYGHPAPVTLERLAVARVPVWRTDRDGTIRVTTDGKTFTVRGGRATRTFDLNRGTPRAASLAGHDP
jgi:competence protein ComEC